MITAIKNQVEAGDLLLDATGKPWVIAEEDILNPPGCSPTRQTPSIAPPAAHAAQSGIPRCLSLPVRARRLTS